MIRIVLIIIGMFFSLTAYADISDADKSKAPGFSTSMNQMSGEYKY